jgi:hypothetical protein
MGLRRSAASRHTPAHALPPAETAKLKAILSAVKPKRHGAHSADVHAAEVSSERPASPRVRRWPFRVRGQGARPIPDMLAGESAWQQGARVVRTPAFGAAAIAYLASAWIAVGAMGPSPSPEEPPTARNAGTNPRNAPIAVLGTAPGMVPHQESDATPTATEIDPQFFANLQRVMDGINERAGYSGPGNSRQGSDETAPGRDEVFAPVAGAPAAPSPAQPPGLIVDPNGEPAAPLPPGPSELQPPAVIPDNHIAAVLPPDASAPPQPAIAPPTQAAVIPDGSSLVEVVGQQPVGPLPGPTP